MLNVIEVKTGSRSYPIHVGSDNGRQLSRLISAHGSDGRLFVVYDVAVYALHSPRLRRLVPALRNKAIDYVLPSGERTKSAKTVQQLYDFFLAEGISRSDFILAVGGGVISDLVGFVAATLMRGIRWGAVPTSLLAMVDAAIGGKTGINHKLGKNLIGAFWQPSFVSCDIGFLHTLPVRQVRCGLGEIVKYCGLIGDTIYNVLEDYLAAGDLYDEARLVDIVTLAAAFKAEIVSGDERDEGERMFLNLGHTFGHAIERALEYHRLLHGEAVTLGLLGAVELSVLCRPSSARRLAEYRELLQRCVSLLPHRSIDARVVFEGLALDKKRRRGHLRLVLLDRPGRPYICEPPKVTLVRRAIDRMLLIYNTAKEGHGKNTGS